MRRQAPTTADFPGTEPGPDDYAGANAIDPDRWLSSEFSIGAQDVDPHKLGMATPHCICVAHCW
jgi:hypothetical protein